jgi:hypothetical protein
LIMLNCHLLLFFHGATGLIHEATLALELQVRFWENIQSVDYF